MQSKVKYFAYTHPDAPPTPPHTHTPADCARLTASGLAAMAVMNMAEETVVVWKHVFIRYAPIFFWVPFSGSDPQARHRALARGKKMPPASRQDRCMRA